MRAALFVVVVGCSHAPATVNIAAAVAPAAPPRAIETRGTNVRFEGNHEVSRARLLDAMTFDDAEADVARILGAYYDLGYVEAKVDEPIAEGRITRYVIHEGVRFRIGTIEARDVDENGAPLRAPDGIPTRRHFRSRPGDWFNRRVLAEDVSAVRRLYRDIGHAMADVTPQLDVDRVHRTVSLDMQVVLGPRVTIDRVDVIGGDSSVRRSIDIADGDLFSESRIEAAKAKLVATARWERVDVSWAGIDPKAPAPVARLTFELTPR